MEIGRDLPEITPMNNTTNEIPRARIGWAKRTLF
jgi:hypothetical protein